MNPFNILINYLIADSRAKHYNVTDTQKVKNTAVLIGAFSQNPIVDYLVIDNQAKNLQKNITGVVNQISNETGQNSSPSIPTPKLNEITFPSEEQIKKVLAEVISERFQHQFLKPLNDEIEQINCDFEKDLIAFNINNELIEVNNLKKDIEELAKHKNIKQLNSEDNEVFTKLKKLTHKNNYFEKIIVAIKKQKEPLAINLSLMIKLNPIRSAILHLEGKLREIDTLSTDKPT